MSGTIFRLLSVSELWPFDCVLGFFIYVYNLHSSTLHNSLTVHDIFRQFYRKGDVSHAKMVLF